MDKELFDSIILLRVPMRSITTSVRLPSLECTIKWSRSSSSMTNVMLSNSFGEDSFNTDASAVQFLVESCRHVIMAVGDNFGDDFFDLAALE